MVLLAYSVLSALPVALLMLLSYRSRLPVFVYDPRAHEYRVPEVALFIANNPTRKHFVAISRISDKREVLDALVFMEVDPESLDLNFASVARLATGWSSIERNCCISATRELGRAEALQIKNRLRANDSMSLVFERGANREV